MSPFLSILCCLLTLAALPAFAAPRYSVTDLGTLPGGKYVYVTGINNKGQVVGWVKSAHIRTRGFLWTGTMHDLGTIPNFRNCKAVGINDHSQIIGQDETDEVDPLYDVRGQSFVWQNGQRTSLPRISTDYSNFNENRLIDVGAIAINNRGQVLGDSRNLLTNGVATEIALHPTAAYDTGRVISINDAGQIACEKLVAFPDGTPGTGKGELSSHPFLWQNGKATDLGLLPGCEAGQVSGINAYGLVVGWMDTFASATGMITECSFLWDGSRLVKIKNLNGYTSSLAYGINAGSQVVGKCIRHRGYAHAYCWQNGTTTDLNNYIPKHSGWILEAAYKINDHGQIIGVGTHGSSHYRAFLLTPQK